MRSVITTKAQRRYDNRFERVVGQPTENRRATDPLGRDNMKQNEHVSLFVRPKMILDQKGGCLGSLFFRLLRVFRTDFFLDFQ